MIAWESRRERAALALLEERSMRSKLEVCGSCSGFLPAQVKACPNCQTARATKRSLASGLPLRLGALGTLLTGGTMAITLMACYGAPCTADNCGPYYPNDSGQEDDDSGPNTPDVKVTPNDAGSDAKSDADASDDAAIGDAATDGG